MIDNKDKLIQYYNIYIDEEYTDYTREQFYEALPIYYEICQIYDYETFNLIMHLIKIMNKNITESNLNLYFPIID